MTVATVNELPRRLEPVTRDPFLKAAEAHTLARGETTHIGTAAGRQIRERALLRARAGLAATVLRTMGGLAVATLVLLALGVAPAAAAPDDEDPDGSQCLPPQCQPPAAPTALTVVATDAGAISLEWRTTGGWTRNELQRQPHAGGPWSVAADVPAPERGGPMARVDAGLTPDDAYCYRAVAVNDDNGEQSLPSDETCAVATDSAPAAPNGLTATATSPSVIALAWYDAARNEHETRLEQQTGQGGWTLVARYGIGGTGPMARYITGLQPSTRYCYRLRASNLRGEGVSPEACATTTSPPLHQDGCGESACATLLEPRPPSPGFMEVVPPPPPPPSCTATGVFAFTLRLANPSTSHFEFAGDPAGTPGLASGAVVTGVTNATLKEQFGGNAGVGPYWVTHASRGPAPLEAGVESEAFNGTPVTGSWTAQWRGIASAQNGAYTQGQLTKQHTVTLRIRWRDPGCTA